MNVAGLMAQPSSREREIVRLLVAGCSNAEIAERLGLLLQTVKNRLCEIYERTGTRNRVTLALQASHELRG